MKIFNVGDVLTASDTNEYLVNTRFVIKPGDTSRNTTTTMTNDPDLSVAADAGKSYLTEVLVQYGATIGADIKATFTVPAGATFSGQLTGQGAGTSYLANGVDAGFPVTGTFSMNGGGAFDLGFRLSGVLVTDGSAGNLTLKWAQNTSNAANTTVRAGSFMLLRRVA
jgi:hypothetical protein